MDVLDILIEQEALARSKKLYYQAKANKQAEIADMYLKAIKKQKAGQDRSTSALKINFIIL